MRRLTVLALLALVGGFALLGYSAAIGEGRVALFLIFPFFTGSGIASFAGMVLVMLGLFLGFLSMAGFGLPGAESVSPPAVAPSTTPASPAKKFGGVVLLGPVPIVFGSDRRVTTAMLVLAIVLTILLVLFFLWTRVPP